ncbi:MAG: ABC transporter ATP-binding protein [Bacteriovoracaceae bacterium]|nr:ABC transporter ATP-binding protein [Bacteriovoracaceae bacterium]
MSETLLSTKDLNVHYGAIHAIKGIDIEVHKGEIVTILGCNGAGKSTTLRTISGLIRPSSGSITYKDQNIEKTPPHDIVAMGLAQSPEGRLVFPDLTVMENLEMGAFLRKDKPEIKRDLEFVYGLFPKMKDRSKQLAGTLSGGEQQMLAIGRALMSAPDLLLLDEPSLGIAPILVQAIFKAIVEVNKTQGKTILLVEQNAFAALKIADRGYVLETGMVTITGTGHDLLSNEEVKNAYLGH